MQANDVQKHLVRIACLTYEGNVVEHRLPIGGNGFQDWIQTSQISEHRILPQMANYPWLSLIEPVHARDRSGGEDAVWLRTDADSGNGSGSKYVAIEKISRLFDSVTGKHPGHH